MEHPSVCFIFTGGKLEWTTPIWTDWATAAHFPFFKLLSFTTRHSLSVMTWNDKIQDDPALAGGMWADCHEITLLWDIVTSRSHFHHTVSCTSEVCMEHESHLLLISCVSEWLDPQLRTCREDLSMQEKMDWTSFLRSPTWWWEEMMWARFLQRVPFRFISACLLGTMSTQVASRFPLVTKICFRAPTNGHRGHSFVFHSWGIPWEGVHVLKVVGL